MREAKAGPRKPSSLALAQSSWALALGEEMGKGEALGGLLLMYDLQA